ncbi:MAG: prolipoprotein diacylglyceryl transferase family protein [Chloroflexota bacterium]
MLPILQIGPLALQTPGLALLAGLWLGLSLAERYSQARGVSPNALYNLVFTTLLAALAGARLSYLAQYPAVFLESPLSLLSLNPSLLDPWGAAAGAVLAALIYGQRSRLPFWSTLDALAPLLGVLAIGVGLSHLASGSAFGAPTGLPWAVNLWGADRHPSQVYETLAAGLILALLWPGRALRWGWAPGVYALAFIALHAAARLALEAFRGDSLLLPGGLRTAQPAAWIILALALWAISRRHATFTRQTASNDLMDQSTTGGSEDVGRAGL